MAQKYSRQRETILRELCSRTDHPTAEDIYAVVKREMPRISLGTVYRNLSQLSDDGVIIRIKGCNGPDRFDGCAENHYHFLCRECNSVIDVPMKVDARLEREAGERSGMNVEAHTVLFFGVCAECEKFNRNKIG